MSLIVLLNTVVLSMYYYGMSKEYEDWLDTLNFSFTITFAVELGIKLSGIGISMYFNDSMNYIDFSVVLFSIIELIFLNNTNSAISALRAIRIFRVLRVARLFRYL